MFCFCCCLRHLILIFFFFNDTATTEIYTLSLHDALPILQILRLGGEGDQDVRGGGRPHGAGDTHDALGSSRSEEHTSELQSRLHLVCRLLLEKKKNTINRNSAPCQTTTPCRATCTATSPT